MGYHSEDCASEVQGQGVGGMRRGSGVRFTESRGQQLPLQAGRDRLRQWLNFQERGEIGKGEIGEVEECLENILRVELDRPPSCVCDTETTTTILLSPDAPSTQPSLEPRPTGKLPLPPWDLRALPIKVSDGRAHTYPGAKHSSSQRG